MSSHYTVPLCLPGALSLLQLSLHREGAQQPKCCGGSTCHDGSPDEQAHVVVLEAGGSSCLSWGKSSCHLSHSPYPSKLLLSLACDAWDKCHWSFQRPLQ